MKSYRNITVWENKRRSEKLAEFRTLVISYFDHVHGDTEASGVQAAKLRYRINCILSDVGAIITASDQTTRVEWLYGAPAVGYKRATIDIIQDMFMLPEESKEELQFHMLDVVDRAAGTYSEDHRRALVRTLNPLWWFSRALSFVTYLPFALMGLSGFDSRRAQRSLAGRVVRLLVALIILGGAVFTILQALYTMGVISSLTSS